MVPLKFAEFFSRPDWQKEGIYDQAINIEPFVESFYGYLLPFHKPSST